MTELLNLIHAWHQSLQFIFILCIATLLTALVSRCLTLFTKNFMNALVILFRGWPPEHVNSLDEEDNDV